MSRCRGLIPVVLCLTWTCATRVVAQPPPPLNTGSEPGNRYNAPETRPAGRIDGVGPPAGDGPTAARSLLGGFDYPYGGPVPCDKPPGGECVPPPAPQPVPFGGPWYSRPKLTGDWWGRREQLRDYGVTLDLSATTYYQGVASGGLQETFRFGGRNDYLLNLDGQKAGLWQGLFLNVHGETVYGESVNLASGAIVPVNIGRSLPVVDRNVSAMTAFKFTQALSEHFVLFGGKINTVDNLQQPFMPGRGLDAGFMNGAFVFNPVLGRTIPYSTFGAGAAVLADGQPVATLTVYDTKDASTTSAFDGLFTNGAIIYPTVTLPTQFFGLPGHQTVWGAYSSARYGIVTPDSLTLVSAVLAAQGVPPPPATVRGSWWVVYRFDQALWVDPSDKTRSWGVFGDAGISDGKPNPIRWSAILGVGGSSALRGRPLDSFGVAYYYLGLASEFKNLIQPLVPLRDERGLELFYNVGVTPWCRVTADLQVVTPALRLAETALVLGLRARLDF